VHLSVAIVFGLGFATILTLVVTPAMLMALANVATWRSRFRAWRARRASGTGGLQAMPAE
jgi:multidrug efflux pump